jgi:CubicO group peptidase (beta-lactamase class C family)
MSDPCIAAPEEIGFDPIGYRRVCDLLQRWTDADDVPAAAICVGRRGRAVAPRFFGRQCAERDSPPLRDDALFLVASLTKPVTVAGVMLLVERGELTLDDTVASIVPEFAANGKASVQIRHLMTHTSGLPDQLPDNEKLRTAHQPLAAFVDGACASNLLFPPGTKVSYQSMGTALLGEIVRRLTGQSIADFLRREFFDPLGMRDTSLGWQPDKRERIAAVRLPPGTEKTDWHWNTPYWLGFGAPWGGLITSPLDYAKFCQLMLNGGTLGGVRLLSAATVRAMTTNQLAGMPLIPEEDRRCRPWGLGWRLHWPAYSPNFGDLLGPRSYGHWGATGTVCWMDPDSEAFCVLFTTRPQDEDGRFLARASNAVAAAIVT